MHFFESLKIKNYRLFFAGQGLSLIGTWMQQMAITWLIYRQTHSTLIVGVVSFSAQVPTFFLSTFFGVFVDKLNRYKVLFWTQFFSLIQALVLTLLFYVNFTPTWTIIFLSFFLGVINALDVPNRQTFIMDMVENDKALIPNTIALNSALFNGARLIGPALAGIIISQWGEGLCFIINSLSFIGVLFALTAMKINIKYSTEKIHWNLTKIIDDFVEGYKYVSQKLLVKSVLQLLGTTSLIGAYYVLLPAFSSKILNGDSRTLGFLNAASALGALLGTIYLGTRSNTKNLKRFISLGSLIFCLGLFAFSLSRNLYLSLFLNFFIGAGIMLQLVSSNTLLQTSVENDKRGRVMSLFAVSHLGIMPFGSLLLGASAASIGEVSTLALSSLVLFTISRYLIHFRITKNQPT